MWSGALLRCFRPIYGTRAEFWWKYGGFHRCMWRGRPILSTNRRCSMKSSQRRRCLLWAVPLPSSIQNHGIRDPPKPCSTELSAFLCLPCSSPEKKASCLRKIQRISVQRMRSESFLGYFGLLPAIAFLLLIGEEEEAETRALLLLAAAWMPFYLPAVIAKLCVTLVLVQHTLDKIRLGFPNKT